MNTYTQARDSDRSATEIMGRKRQEKALREFKHVLEDLMFLLRSASGMETVYMYWINRSREQFILETKSTSFSNVMFQDRVGFYNHFLNNYRDITEPVVIEVGANLPGESLDHYYNGVPVNYVTLLPFINNGQTVAITVLESRNRIFSDDKSDVIYSYINALRNVLNTYLEISDLYERQEEWVDYEEKLAVLDTRGHHMELISKMLDAMQSFLHKGGVSFVARGMDSWSNILNSKEAYNPPPLGMPLEERTLAYEAIQKGKPEFAIHINNNPKRLSPRELHTEGASMAIPLMMNDRRQGVVLVYDQNPLIFKESTKHKLINFVRVAGLKIKANDPKLDVDKNFLANEYGAFIPDVWERTVDNVLRRQHNGHARYHSWLGLTTLADLPAIRTKFRLEDLQMMQCDLVRTINPSRFGIPGIVGSHSDYIYAFLIQSKDRRAVEHWSRALKKEFSEPFELSNGQYIESGIKVGYTLLDSSLSDSYQAISNAKAALSQAVKGSQGQTHS